MMGRKTFFGNVKTNIGVQSVMYYFTDEDTIFCIDLNDYSEFYTHYKSLIV